MKFNPILLKFFAAVALFALWAAMVWTHLVPAGDLAHAIEAALLGLGVFHAAGGTSTASPAPSAPSPASTSTSASATPPTA